MAGIENQGPGTGKIRHALAIATAGGLLYGAAFNLVLRPGWGWLAPVAALVGLALILKTVAGDRIPPTAYRLPPTILRAALLGMAAYAAAAAVGLFWMTCITPAAWVGIVLYLALYGAAFGALAALIRRGTFAAAFPWLAAALWTALEFVRASWAFTGFPWMLAGSVWAGIPAAMGLADLGGVWLVSFVTVLVPALLAAAEKPALFWKRAAVVAAVALAALGYGFFRSYRQPATGNSASPCVASFAEQGRQPSFRIAAVQPLVPFKVGPKADPAEMLREQQAILAGVEPGSADLLVWSETMVPGDLLEETPEYLAPAAREKRCCFLAGGVVHETDASGERTGRAFNSALLLDPQGEVAGRYDKRHLVPFGEYVPFGGRFPGAKHIFDLIGTVFTAPDGERPLPEAGGVALGVSICYEDCFPYISRRDARRGAGLLVNLTNDSWFRRSSEARQHLALGAFRAVETRRPLARATNTGISALIDSDGRITVPPNGGLWEKGLVRMDVALAPRAPTVCMAIGDFFAWLALIAAGAGAVMGLWRRNKPEGESAAK